jgi:hypothetical protein
LNGEPSYERDIKPLFRETDREEMSFAFDLWDYEDVKENSDGILERVASGEMPCDFPWPPDRVSAFRMWVEAGMPA